MILTESIGKKLQGWGLILMAIFLPWSKAGLGISEGIAALGVLFQWNSFSKSIVPFFKKSWTFWGLFVLYLLGTLNSNSIDEGWKQLNIKHLVFTFPVYWYLIPLEPSIKKFIKNALLFSTSIWCLLALSALVLPDRTYPWLQEESGYRGGGTYFLNSEHPFAYTHQQGIIAGDSLSFSVQGEGLEFCLDSKSFSHFISFPLPKDTTFSFVFKENTSALWYFKNRDGDATILPLDCRLNGNSIPFNHEFQHSKIPSPFTRRPIAGLLLASIFLWMMMELFEGKTWLIPTLVGTLSLVTLLFLENRLGLIGAGLGLIWMLFRHRSKRNLLMALAVVAVLLLTTSLWLEAFSRLWNEVTSFQGIDDQLAYGSANKRMALWQVYWQVAQEHAVLGTGVGDVLTDAQAWLKQHHQPWQWIHWPHNQYLTALVQFGWLGGMVWLFLLGHSFFHQSKKSWWPILALALMSLLTDNTLDTQQGVTWLLWMIFLGKKD